MYVNTCIYMYIFLFKGYPFKKMITELKVSIFHYVTYYITTKNVAYLDTNTQSVLIQVGI